MQDSQIWLSKKYSNQKETAEINVPYDGGIEGSLIISDFIKLEKIEVKRGNKINSLLIFNCPKLKKIEIRNNELQQIMADQELKELEILELRGNLLSFIPREFLSPSLKELDISHNQFVTLPENIDDLVALENFHCNWNKELSGNLDISVFTKLVYLDISHTKFLPPLTFLEEFAQQNNPDLSLAKIIVRSLQSQVKNLKRKEKLEFYVTPQSFNITWFIVSLASC